MEWGRACSLLTLVLAPGKRVPGFGSSLVPCAGTRCHEGELSRGARCPSPAPAVPDAAPGCLWQGGRLLLPERAGLRRCSPGDGSV